MPVRGDEVADRIEGRIREAVDRMMGEIHTSIQDVRKAIEQQLDAAVQSVQADVKGFTFRAPLDEGIRELEEALSTPAPPPSSAGAAEVRRAFRAIESGRNQVEVLTALLEQCLQYGSRAALLILKGDTFSGWKATGFSAHGGSDEGMKRFTGGRTEAAQFESLLAEEKVVEWDGANLAERFGVSAPARALLIPMVIKDKVAAALYVDATRDDLPRFDRASLELLVFTTGLLIDTLAIRKKIPSPSLSGEQTAAPAMNRIGMAGSAQQSEMPESAEQTVAIRQPQMQPPPGIHTPEPSASEGESSPAEPRTWGEASASTDERAPEPPSRTFQLEHPEEQPRAEERAPEPASSSEPGQFATAMFPTFRPEPAAEPADEHPPATEEPAQDEAVPESSGAQETPGDRPSTQYVPPPGLARGGAFGPRNSDERRHDEARRFARLLVSEIKLYNESKVEQGRREKDIYDRLKEDIDRSRQMYDDRVPEDVRNGTNYFFDELVRILADGNRESLGL